MFGVIIFSSDYIYIYIYPAQIITDNADDIALLEGGARGVMVIVVGNGHGDTSSNPGWDCNSYSTNTLG